MIDSMVYLKSRKHIKSFGGIVMSSLNQMLKVYVPTTVNVNQQVVDNSLQVEHVAGLLSQLCGGATAQEVEGFYKSDSGELVKEKITIVYSYTTFWNRLKIRRQLVEIANWLKKEMSQESIAVEINQKREFF